MRKQFYLPFHKPTYTLRFNCEGHDMYLGGSHHDFSVVAELESINWEELIYKRVDHREVLRLVPSNIEITDHYLQRITDHQGRVMWETARPERKETPKWIRTLKEIGTLFSSPFLLLAMGTAYLWKRITNK